MHVYSNVSPTAFDGAYSHEIMYKIAASDSHDPCHISRALLSFPSHTSPHESHLFASIRPFFFPQTITIN